MNVGESIAGYTITKKVGSGSFGQVYLARDEKEREVVFKVCSYGGNLLLEYELLRHWWNEQLKHPIIWPTTWGACARASLPRVYGAIDEPVIDRFCMILENGGQTVEQNLQYFHRNWPAVRVFIRAMSLVLGSLHALRYVHNDIKPANVLMELDSTGCMQFTLIDFGCSTSLSHNRNHRNTFTGTTRYASIRQMQAKWTTVGADDMESLLYMAMFLYYGTLPWITHHATRRPSSHAQTAPELRQRLLMRRKEVLYSKQQESVDFAGSDSSTTAGLAELLIYLFLLPYEEPVDYSRFSSLR